MNTPLLSRPVRAAAAWTLLLALAHPTAGNSAEGGDWPHWGGSAGGLRYSALNQITPTNVDKLKIAWTWHTGETAPAGAPPLMLQVTPLLAEGTLYACTGSNRVVALDPASGRERWAFDPKVKLDGHFLRNCRGVTFHRDPAAAKDAVCAARIVTGTLDARLIALDAATGRPCPGFGRNGEIDLAADLGEVRTGEYGLPSPPVVAGGRIIVGAAVLDNSRTDAPAGVVRAFDLQTGQLAWSWNPLPPGRSDAELARPGEKYARATTNAWSVFSVDEERGLVFVPTGNTIPDHYGQLRHGLDYYSTSVVALEAASGALRWHFQTVHHDLWDYDVPAQPVLFDFPTAAGPVPAVAQSTKQGFIFILDRQTGQPLVPVEERPVPRQGGLPGEEPAPTQPFPANRTYDLHPGPLTEENAWGFTFWDRGKCRDKVKALRNEGIFTPPSEQGSVMMPHNMGIMNWGGLAIDPERHLLVVNASYIGSELKAWPREEADRQRAAGNVYVQPGEGTPYGYSVIPLLSPLGAPCNPPPWGTLVAIDLAAGKRVWEVTLGTTRDVAPFPFWFNLGAPSVGGPIITSSGLVFIAGTTDNFLRAFALDSGAELWRARLPAGGQATPMTYQAEGRQYVVIAAGGHALLRTTGGDSLIAYRLED